MSWTPFALAAIALSVGATAVSAILTARRARRDFGREEGNRQLLRDLQRFWPVAVLVLAAPVVLVGLAPSAIGQFGIGTFRAVFFPISLALLGWIVRDAWRFARRHERLGEFVAALPRSSLIPPFVHLGMAGCFALMLCFRAYLSFAFDRSFGWDAGLWAAMCIQNVLLARASTEIRTRGLFFGLHDRRWSEVRGWHWTAGARGPVLMLELGRWPAVSFAIPAAQRASIDAALTRLAGASR